jgi:hypothetical protein
VLICLWLYLIEYVVLVGGPLFQTAKVVCRFYKKQGVQQQKVQGFTGALIC